MIIYLWNKLKDINVRYYLFIYKIIFLSILKLV